MVLPQNDMVGVSGDRAKGLHIPKVVLRKWHALSFKAQRESPARCGMSEHQGIIRRRNGAADVGHRSPLRSGRLAIAQN